MKISILYLIATTTMLGCGKVSGAIGHLDGSPTALQNDFKNSSIVTTGHGVANGTTAYPVILHLINSNASPVIGYVPTYSVTPSASVSRNACTPSDSTGTSVCTFTCGVSGSETFLVTNISTFTLQANIVFDPFSHTNTLALISGSQQSATGGGYKMMSSIGHLNTLSPSTAGGWLTHTTSQSSMASQ
jgi:hypothetical protein